MTNQRSWKFLIFWANNNIRSDRFSILFLIAHFTEIKKWERKCLFVIACALGIIFVLWSASTVVSTLAIWTAMATWRWSWLVIACAFGITFILWSTLVIVSTFTVWITVAGCWFWTMWTTAMRHEKNEGIYWIFECVLSLNGRLFSGFYLVGTLQFSLILDRS
jgi:hypothetical protein